VSRGENLCAPVPPYFPHRSREKLSEKNLSTNGLDNISTDTHINHSIILASRSHKNPARAVHLDTLFDQHPFVRLSDAMRHHPRRGTSNCTKGKRWSSLDMACLL